MSKIHYLTITARRNRTTKSLYMNVLPSDLYRVRHAYRYMRSKGMHVSIARMLIYRLLSTGRTSKSSVEIENEASDERLLQVF